MAFQQVPDVAAGSGGGNFSSERRQFFNQCGRMYYCGSLSFKDSSHQWRTVPIFDDDCLEGKPETYRLLKELRRAMRVSSSQFYLFGTNARSIHQNEYGYLPYKNDGAAGRLSVSAPAIRNTAQLFGGLPHNQASAGAQTNGQFLEYTCGDQMHVDCRLVVDYRFGFIYMTFGHYHEDSFALLVRSVVELRFELGPILPALDAALTY